MTRTTTPRNLLSLAIVMGLAAPLAHAQQAAGPQQPESSRTLDSITVTARKREETLQEVPVAVTAFTADSIDKLNVRDLGDLDAQVPNLTIYAARGSTSTVTAYIRGVGQADPLWGVDPGVGIYLDDVYIARPQGALLDVFDVGRIEVLRGPQGTLYGKNTTGGAIKYISRGLPNELDGFASLTVGNYKPDRRQGRARWPDRRCRQRPARALAVASLNRDGFGEIVGRDQPVSDKQINAALPAGRVRQRGVRRAVRLRLDGGHVPACAVRRCWRRNCWRRPRRRWTAATTSAAPCATSTTPT